MKLQRYSFLLIFFGMNFFFNSASHSAQTEKSKEETQAEEKMKINYGGDGRPLVSISINKLTSRDSNGEVVLRKDAVQFVHSIINSDKFEFRVTDTGHGKEMAEILEKIRNGLDVRHKDKLIDWSQVEIKDRVRIGRKILDGHVYSAPFLYLGKKASYPYLKTALADIAMARHNFNFASAKNKPFRNSFKEPGYSRDYADILFFLGKDAFDPILKTVKPEYSKKSPITSCFISVKGEQKDFPLKLCLKHIGFIYKWKDKGKKECGVYNPEGTLFIKEANSLDCEPKYIQEFNKQVIINKNLCNKAAGCISKIIGNKLEELSRELEKIIKKIEIKKLRKSIYDNSDFDYTTPLSDQMNKFSEFIEKCKNVRNEEQLQSFLKNNPKEGEKYRKTLALLEKGYRDAIAKNEFDLSEDKKHKNVLKNGIENYRKCIIPKVLKKIKSIGDEYHEDCLYKATKVILEEHGKALLSEEKMKDPGFKSVINSCLANTVREYDSPVEQIAQGFSKLTFMFDARYDLSRCFSQMKNGLNNSKLAPEFEKSYLTIKDKGLDFPKLDYIKAVKDHSVKCKSFIKKGKKSKSYLKCLEESHEKSVLTLYSGLLTKKNSAIKDKIGKSIAVERKIKRFIESSSDIRKCVFGGLSKNKRIDSCNEESVKLILANLEKKNPFRSKKFSLAVEAISEELRPKVKCLSRDISVFHWGKDITDKEKAVDLKTLKSPVYAALRQRVATLGPLILNQIPGSEGGVMAGRGLYAAVDTKVTRGYGNTLLEINLPKKSCYLDLRSKLARDLSVDRIAATGIPVSFDAFSKLEKYGCNLFRKKISNEEKAILEKKKSEKMKEKDRIEKQLDKDYDSFLKSYRRLKTKVNKKRMKKLSLLKDHYNRKKEKKKQRLSLLNSEVSQNPEEIRQIEKQLREDNDTFVKKHRMLETKEMKKLIRLEDVYRKKKEEKEKRLLLVQEKLRELRGLNNKEAIIIRGSSKEKGGVYAYIPKRIFEQDRKCNDIFNGVVSKLNLNFFAYSYGRFGPRFCDKGKGLDAAFVMLNTSFFGNINTFNAKQVEEALRKNKENGTPIPKEIKRLLQLHRNIFPGEKIHKLLEDNKSIANETSSSNVNYWKSRLFSCDRSHEGDYTDAEK